MEKENAKEAPSQNETDSCVKHDYSAQDVADAFVRQYYSILQVNPKDGHNFYQDQSIRAHQAADGSMKSATTLMEIDHEIMNSSVKEWNPDLKTVYAQDSVMDSVIVGVTGSLIDADNVTRNFAQTFFLAPQDGGGFYVHNDFLQFIQIDKISVDDDDATPLTAPHVDHTEKESYVETVKKDQNEKSKSKKDDVDSGNKFADSAKGKKSLPSEPKQKTEPVTVKPAKNMEEEAQKASYASIVAKEGSASPPEASPNDIVVPKSSAVTVPKQSVIPVSKQSVKALTFPNGPLENIYDVKSVRVKDLPPNITEESLVEVLKQFGPLKQKNIQIKEYSQDGYRYAFVEFDNPKSARNAVEARFIQFEGRECQIQYKKLPNQGGPNYMGRPQFQNRGGFRNDNLWGHDGEGQGRSTGNWGRHNKHDNFVGGQHSSQNWDNNYNRRNCYFQDQAPAQARNYN